MKRKPRRRPPPSVPPMPSREELLRKKTLRLDEAAYLQGVCINTIRHGIKCGRVQAVLVGNGDQRKHLRVVTASLFPAGLCAEFATPEVH